LIIRNALEELGYLKPDPENSPATDKNLLAGK
jgi:hypothetical protein